MSRAIEAPAGGCVFFNYGTGHGTKANNTDHERAGLAFHFLHTDFIPEHYDERQRKYLVHVTGPQASGGRNEYGVQVAGTWEAEVQRVLQGA